MIIKQIAFIFLTFLTGILFFTINVSSQPGTIFSAQKQNIALYEYDFLIPLSYESEDLDAFTLQVMNRLELLKTRQEIIDFRSIQRTQTKSTRVNDKTALKWLTILYKDAVFSKIKHRKYDYDKVNFVYQEFSKPSPEIQLNDLQETAPHFSKGYSKQLRQSIEAVNAEEHERKKRIHRPTALSILDLINDRLALSQNYFQSRVRERYKSSDLKFSDKAQVLEKLIDIKDWGLAKYALSYFQYLERKGNLEQTQQHWLDSKEKEMQQ